MSLYVASKWRLYEYHLCLLATYKFVYYGREILQIRMFTTYELVYGHENTTNLYVFNYMNWILRTRTWLTKKIAIEKTYKFIQNSACIQKEKTLSIKKGLPIEPRYAGICKFTTKIFQTPTQKGGWYDFFYIKISKKKSEKRDPKNPFIVHLVNHTFFDTTCPFLCVFMHKTPTIRDGA
jgi:hypothetical protein